ncbi:hypothetical protein M0R45_029566 [Rubus argutus]|uniref:Small ribosomal subunit protein eS4 N-terminal domain-containing protein n=1 Tax=Rubus argutus TaxID=59490 RepID=A0AAW1WB14_RUBAR
MARGLKKHLKRLSAPKHWMLDKLGDAIAPKPSSGPQISSSKGFMENVDQPHVLPVDDSDIDLKLIEKLLKYFSCKVNDSEQICDLLKGIRYQCELSSLKELLELAPIKKVMLSTDGYAFPETFYLGAKKALEVVFSVLCDAYADGDLSIPEASEAAKDIFHKMQSNFTRLIMLSNLLSDASGQQRCRVVPVRHFNDIVTKNDIGLTVACMGMTSFTDGPADEINLTGVGEIRLTPDLTTKWRIPWVEQEEMVMANMHLKPGEAWEYCPREALRSVSKILKDEFNLVC